MNYTSFFTAKFISWLLFWFTLKVVFVIGSVVGRLCGGCLERGRVKNRVFHVEECIYNLQISLSETNLLSESLLFVLSAIIRAKCNSLYAN